MSPDLIVGNVQTVKGHVQQPHASDYTHTDDCSARSFPSPIPCPCKSTGIVLQSNPTCDRPGLYLSQYNCSLVWVIHQNPTPALVPDRTSIYSGLVWGTPHPNQAFIYTYGCCSLAKSSPPHNPVHTHANTCWCLAQPGLPATLALMPINRSCSPTEGCSQFLH